MARKRKNTRMIPRETRRDDTAALTAALAAMSPEQRDVCTIGMVTGHGVVLTGPVLAECWLGQHDEAEPDDFNRAMTAALARQYKRVTGHAISPDEAYAVIEPDCEDGGVARSCPGCHPAGCSLRCCGV